MLLPERSLVVEIESKKKLIAGPAGHGETLVTFEGLSNSGKATHSPWTGEKAFDSM